MTAPLLSTERNMVKNRKGFILLGIMKNTIFLSLLALLVISPITSLAQTASTSSVPGYRLGQPFKEIREEYQQKRDELKDQAKATREENREQVRNATSSEARQQIREENRAQIDAVRRERIMLFARRMIDRLNAALDRSRGFVSRINSLIADWQNDGKNTTEAQAKLTEANQAINAGQAKVDNILPAVESALTATSTKDAFANVKGVVAEAVTAVKTAHAKVVEVIKSLKNSNNNQATTTPSN